MSKQKDNETKPTEQKGNLTQRSKMILETSMDGFCVVGVDGKLLEVNSSLCDITGYSKEELLRMKVTDIEAAETAKQTAQHIDRVTKQGYDRFETKHHRKDGKIIDIEVSTQLCDSGEDGFFLCFFRDITERKKAEAKTEETHVLLRAIIEETPDCIFLKDRQSRYQILNTAAAHALGKTSAREIAGRNDMEILSPEQARRLQEADRRIMNSGKTEVCEEPVGDRTFMSMKTPYRDKEDNVIGIIGIARDITERKKDEDALRKSEERYKALFQGAAEGILVADIETKKFNFANPALCRMLGYTEKEIKGMRMHDIHPKEDLEHVLSEFQAQARGEKTLSLGIPCLRKDGTTIYADIKTSKIMIDERERNIGFFTDITEHKQLRANLENYKEKVLKTQRHAYVGSIGTIAAHQLNQPLTKINILLDRAIEQIEEASYSPVALKNVKEGLDEAKKAASIIQKFRQYSKNSAWESVGKVNVSAVADKIVSVLSERATRTNMRIAIKGLGDLPEVEANEMALEQVFFIIIQNAIEAADGRKRHKLDITGKFADSNIELQFADDCCGIAPENLDRIFDPFFSTKTKDKGLGLGLDIVQQILMSCGGQIRVESQLGKGTTFYVTLPISSALKP